MLTFEFLINSSSHHPDNRRLLSCGILCDPFRMIRNPCGVLCDPYGVFRDLLKRTRGGKYGEMWIN